jgi:predicted dehydrogenase
VTAPNPTAVRTDKPQHQQHDLPRLGFLGVGWIGRNRMQAIAASGAAEVVAVADVDGSVAADAARGAGATVVGPDEIIAHTGLDGLVIATPSAMHARQAIDAFDAGLSVFCQKPLARTAAETVAVVRAAQRADRLLGVDLSYRHMEGTARMREVIASGEIGEVYAADVTFHNAYGPDKPWFTDKALSGGGCVIDLGTHLIDLVQWMVPGPPLRTMTAQLYSRGHRMEPEAEEVEDHALATLQSSSGMTVRMTCSWFTHAGCDAVIDATFHGANGSVSMHNVDGSFYDFETWRCRGTWRERISAPPDAWGGRAAIAWAQQLALADHERDASQMQEFIELATVIDEIYGR